MVKLSSKWGNAKIDKSGYYRISSTKEGNYRKSLAKLIYEENFGKIPKEYRLYHKNGNKTDVSIDNLGLKLKKKYMPKPERVSKPKPELLSEEERKEISINYSKNHSSTGYYRVNKHKDSRRKQGHYWRYRWIENKKVKSLCAPTIDELEKKVRSKGLEWIKF